MEKNFKLINGDCLLVLKDLADNSIDSIVTDPPYGLKFMSKHWDCSVPSVEIWSECLRVLKPGGHLLAFFGTRTYHRGVINIEDAGFEIRDQIQWIYGSGFPKSQDISKAIDKQAGAQREIVKTIKKTPSAHSENMQEGWRRPWAEDHPKTMDITAPATDDAKKWQGWGTALKPAAEIICMAQKPLPEYLELASLALSVCQSQLFASAAKNILKLNQEGPAGALNIAQWIAGESTLTQEGLSELTVILQSESEQTLNSNIELLWALILGETSLLASTFTTSTVTNLITDLKILRYLVSKITHENMHLSDGHGLSADALLVNNLFCAFDLKLNYIQKHSAQDHATSLVAKLDSRTKSEPIVVARKPIEEKTIAANVLKHGTGGINIDSSRITPGDQAPGRWPANILFDEEAANLLGENQRFFYVAKSSKSERNKGCEGLSKVALGVGDERPSGRSMQRLDQILSFGRNERKMENYHPTVKPIKLMEYLIRLITPPNGTVLDPFMGSGSTGVAAIGLGFSFIGIEKEKEYMQIAESRMNSKAESKNKKRENA